MINIPVRVKEALRDGCYLKNYRFIVLNNDGSEDFTIDNNNLVDESVIIDEKLCSSDTIEFGLCEGSSLQFEYFDFPDISEKRLKALLDVQYKAADNTLQWHSIPMGFYDVKECPMQFSTGIRKCTCYNKLKSDYLDADAKDLIVEAVMRGDGSESGTAIVSVLDNLLGGYSISIAPDENTEADIYKGSKSYNEFIFTEHDAEGTTYGNGKYLHVFTLSVYITPEEGYSKDEFYKVVVTVKKISDYLRTLREGITTKYYSYGVLSSGEKDKAYPWEEHLQTKNGATITIENSAEEVLLKSLEFSEYVSDNLNTEYFTNLNGKKMIHLRVPVIYRLDREPSGEIVHAEIDNAFNEMLSTIPEMVEVYKRNLSDIEKYRISEEQVVNMQDVTLRQLQSAVFELSAQYGQLDRETDLFSGTELNNSRLLPSETLYPNNQLYPTGKAIHASKSTYSQLWTDGGGIKKFRNLIVTYKTLDEKNTEIKAVLQRTVNADGTEDYNMSENWLFNSFVWTSEQVGAYADKMVEKMKNLTWLPFEMWCAGLPFIETGDEIEIPTKDGTFTSYVLQRQLNGIQSLQDTYMNGILNVF